MHKYILHDEPVPLPQEQVDKARHMYAYADALADIVSKEPFMIDVLKQALPVQALSNPTVQDEVKKADLVWAFDTANNDRALLVGGAEQLAYSVLRDMPRTLGMMGFRYDSRSDSIESLKQTVEALRLQYRREHHIIKSLSDSFAPLALPLKDIADPMVREKAAQADVFGVIDQDTLQPAHIFCSKRIKELTRKGDKAALSQVKFMSFLFEPEVDDIEAFATALEEIKSKNWQN